MEEEQTEQQETELPEPFRIVPPRHSEARLSSSEAKTVRTWQDKNRIIDQLANKVVHRQLQRRAETIIQQVEAEAKSTNGVLFLVKLTQSQQQELGSLVGQIKAKAESLNEGRSKGKSYSIKQIDESDFKQILLRIYEIVEEEDSRRTNYIMIVKSIIWLTESSITNLYARGIPEGRIVHCIVPTYSDLSDISPFLKIEVMFMDLYNAKHLFCQFLLGILSQKHILPYFPSEATKMITDFDDYPMTYREGVRRVTYLLNRLHLMKVDFKYVDTSLIMGCLNEVLTNSDRQRQGVQDKFYESILLTIYDQNHELQVSEDMIPSKEQEIVALSAEIKRYLERSTTCKREIADLMNFDKQPAAQISKSKHSRQAQLMIPKKVDSMAELLVGKISRILKGTTVDIRQQALSVKWSELCLEKYIAPNFFKEVVKDLERSSLQKMFEHTSNCIEKEHRSALTELQMDLPQYLFQSSVLAYMGAIESSKKQSKPTFKNQIFLNADFRL